MTHALRIPMRTPCLPVPDTWYWDPKERAETMALAEELFKLPDKAHVCPTKPHGMYENVVAGHRASAQSAQGQPERLCFYTLLNPVCAKQAKQCPTAAAYVAVLTAMKQRTAALHSIDRLPLEILLHEIYARLNVTEKRACRVVWRRVRAATQVEKDTHDWERRLRQRAFTPYYLIDNPTMQRRFLQWAHDDFRTSLSRRFWPNCVPSRDLAKLALEAAAMGGAYMVYRECLGFIKTYRLTTQKEEAVAFHTALCAGQFGFIERAFGWIWTSLFWDRVFSDGYASAFAWKTFYRSTAVTHWIEARNEYALGKWADEIVARKLHVGFAGLMSTQLTFMASFLEDRDPTAWDASPSVRAALVACANAGIVSVLDRFKEDSTWTERTLSDVLTARGSPQALSWFRKHRPAYFSPELGAEQAARLRPPYVLQWFLSEGLLDLTEWEPHLFGYSDDSSPLRKWLCSVSPRAAHWHAQSLFGLPPALRDRIRALLPPGNRAQLKCACRLFNEEDRDLSPDLSQADA
jgi:hypothetical protein